MDVRKHTEQQLHKFNLLQKGTRIVVAVSGGPDSMALFHLLHRICLDWEMELVAAHLNHRFRPVESEAEAQLVQALADQLDRPFEYAEVDMPAIIAETKENSQAAARAKRYAFFKQVCDRVHAETVVTAHHADDQAETIFMRILKGASVKSLAGIPDVRLDSSGIRIVRPLLDVPKQALLNYCRDNDIDYALDSSNEQSTYFRNQVRLDILPYLQQFQPQFTQAINRLGKIAADENDFMERSAQQFVDSHVDISHKKSISFDRMELLKLHPALQKRVIPLILKYVALEDVQNYDHRTIESIMQAIHNETRPSVKLHLPSGVQFMREYDRLYVQRNEPSQTEESPGFYYECYQFPIQLQLQGYAVEIQKSLVNDENGENLSIQTNPYECVLDADSFELPLIIRSRLPGDRMSISGMNGTKKVKDIFIDDKVPPSKRDQIPVVVDGSGKIVWIAGIRYSGLYEPNDSSRHLLQIFCRPNNN